MGTTGYTLPVDRATMLDPRYRLQTEALARQLTAQVSEGSTEVPNFLPARETTKSASGNSLTCASSKRSAEMVEILRAWSHSFWAGSEKRLTAMISNLEPETATARAAKTARVGPIFPPAPTIISVPAIPFICLIRASDGVVKALSRSTSVKMTLGSILFPNQNKM